MATTPRGIPLIDTNTKIAPFQAHHNGMANALDTALGNFDNRLLPLEGKMSKPGKVLWSGSVFLNGIQSIDLTESISSQLSGVCLIWSEYASGAAVNVNFTHQFISKAQVQLYSGYGVRLLTKVGADVVSKYFYVTNDKISGNNDNNAAPNNRLVLREVVGV
ncbi:hypothetical protein G7068_16125 [Leucobacter viscericola]|uniref:Uncharacterized protein n=1 Tax=Leucobacter viscericola TaxID=2714935 RepID=A0A6G7XBB4_9MICO|nr:hypothetical protein [Leucobacter viscericola]QIK61792.1 hypothetical protein G7068_00135 [Leucobacter viscericola]QIK64574.1 hypothetical protein G7068_16125 [Leucobacter viscericola]